MALQSPENFEVARLKDQVLATYAKVAQDPDGDFHFHRGAAYAAEYLCYDVDELAVLPRLATDRFAGVGNPLMNADLRPGMVVLDHACGAGTDLLLAARRVGPTGRVIGIDLTPGMRDCAARAAQEAGLGGRVQIREGMMESLPVEDESVDVVLSNGVVNLATDKVQVFREIARVLKPGGRLHLADVAVARELKEDARSNPDLWAACVAGALPEWEFAELAEKVGLADGTVECCFKCFDGTSALEHVSADLCVHGINFTARKP